MKKLFGTDGVRGVAGEFLDAELALALGRAAAGVVERPSPRVLIVRDTRESGSMLASAFAAGVAEAGGDAFLGGVLPTPAASILNRRLGFDLAAVVSASHNPWADNGIKLFGANGRKLPDELEAGIEAEVASEARGAGGERIGRIDRLENALSDYLRELGRAFDADLSGRRVVLDCANGATVRAAPQAFRALGAEVDVIGDAPDGRNINAGVGATAPQALAERVASTGAEIGFAFDGDGDRLIAVDAAGRVRDGDELMALVATHLRDQGRLTGIAVTVMSNFGFHRLMADKGIEVATTAVGDRHVSVELERRGWELGGEQSGHLIWTDFAPTGDGIAAALLVLEALGPRSLADAIEMERLPQELRNVRVRDRDALEGASAVWEAVEREQAALEGRGRVLLRPSGTEPLIRVMAEAPTAEECAEVCARLSEAVERELG
ncbi:phosphoglucosamine mutase [Thermoleophilia bacterium SCSIO 60948]|nr:phosphoglucosamine mutase [Thermoleophilia bacterium SCSIO 60948]